MNGSQVIDLLRTFMIVLGAVSVLWGIYDMFHDGGGAAAVGWKKIIGGIAFAVLAGVIMTWASNEVQTAGQLPDQPTKYIVNVDAQSVNTELWV